MTDFRNKEPKTEAGRKVYEAFKAYNANPTAHRDTPAQLSLLSEEKEKSSSPSLKPTSKNPKDWSVEELIRAQSRINKWYDKNGYGMIEDEKLRSDWERYKITLDKIIEELKRRGVNYNESKT